MTSGRNAPCCSKLPTGSTAVVWPRASTEVVSGRKPVIGGLASWWGGGLPDGTVIGWLWVTAAPRESAFHEGRGSF
ncbi:hypothetical protein GCM10029964_077000 [Kibdelosporangium lantanae]